MSAGSSFFLCLTASLAKWLRRPPRRGKIRSSIPARRGDFFFPGLSHTSDLKTGTPVASDYSWCYGVSVGTGWPGVSILLLGEVESLICNFCLRVAIVYNCLSRSVPEVH